MAKNEVMSHDRADSDDWILWQNLCHVCGVNSTLRHMQAADAAVSVTLIGFLVLGCNLIDSTVPMPKRER